MRTGWVRTRRFFQRDGAGDWCACRTTTPTGAIGMVSRSDRSRGRQIRGRAPQGHRSFTLEMVRCGMIDPDTFARRLDATPIDEAHKRRVANVVREAPRNNRPGTGKEPRRSRKGAAETRPHARPSPATRSAPKLSTSIKSHLARPPERPFPRLQGTPRYCWLSRGWDRTEGFSGKPSPKSRAGAARVVAGASIPHLDLRWGGPAPKSLKTHLSASQRGRINRHSRCRPPYSRAEGRRPRRP